MYAFLARAPRRVRRALPAAALKDHLRTIVAEYMVPAAFVTLDGLPLSPNGKVDRKALREPSRSVAPAAAALEAPRDGLEEVLVGICSDVLGADVGIRDDFFAVGGDSLLAMRLVAYIRDALDVELPLRTFLVAPNIVSMAEALRAIAGAEALDARAKAVLEFSRSGEYRAQSNV
jgi:acyl carrier protein